jgi:GT2 family glycosyltransferase
VPRVSAVVVSYNTRDDVLRCLGSLERDAGMPLEVLVVDNGSEDDSVDAVRREFPSVLLLDNGENLGFARAANRGLRAARAPYALILNSDAEVLPGALEAMVSILDERPGVGAVGPRTLGSDGTPQVSFGPALGPLAEWRQRRLVRGVRNRRPETLREVEQRGRSESEPDWVSGACLLARREALEAVGLFDEGFFLYEEDVDLCLRLRRAGWRIVYTPAATVVHHLGRSVARIPSRARIEYHRSHIRYYRKHNGAACTALLRAYLLGRSALLCLLSLGPGAARQRRRREQLEILRLAGSTRG